MPNSPDVCSTLPIPSGGSPRLALTKVLSGGSPSPGATVVYTLSVANNGDQAAGPVTLSEVVPLGTTFNQASSSPGWTCAPSNASGASCTLVLPSLGAGATESRDFALILSSPFDAPQLSNTACAATEPGINVCSTATHPTTGSPELQVTKILSGQTPLAPGASLTWRLVVTNSGSRAAETVRLQETVPTATTFNAAASDPRWVCQSPAAGSACTLLLSQLAAGATTTVMTTRRITTILNTVMRAELSLYLPDITLD